MTRRWYHGTPNRLPVGTVLVPASQRPGTNVYACTETGDRADVTWITPSPDEALIWAEFAYDMGTGDDTGLWTYEVEPDSRPQRWTDPELRSDGTAFAEYTTTTATITRVVSHTRLLDAA